MNSKFFKLSIPFILLLIIGGCKKDNLGISQKTLNGYWIETEPASIIQFAGTNHKFQFNSDNSFTLERFYWTDVVSSDSCYGSHTDYVSGTYTYDNNSFNFTGKYSNSQFDVIQANNCGETDYTLVTKYTYQNSILTFNSDQDLYFQVALHKQ